MMRDETVQALKDAREMLAALQQAQAEQECRAIAAELERDALKAAIERVRADCEVRFEVPYQFGGDYEKGVWAQAKRTLAALDGPTARDER